MFLATNKDTNVIVSNISIVSYGPKNVKMAKTQQNAWDLDTTFYILVIKGISYT